MFVVNEQHDNPDAKFAKYISELAKGAKQSYGEKIGNPEITQKEYANQLGVRQGTVQAWEKGINTPQFIQMCLMAWDSGQTADQVAADLIGIKFSHLQARIPRNIQQRQVSIPKVPIKEMPTDQLMMLSRRILDEFNTRFQQYEGWANPEG